MVEEKATMDERMEWKLRRIGKKIKLVDMSEAVGCSYNMISLFENSHANLDPDKFIKYKNYIKEHK